MNGVRTNSVSSPTLSRNFDYSLEASSSYAQGVKRHVQWMLKHDEGYGPVDGMLELNAWEKSAESSRLRARAYVEEHGSYDTDLPLPEPLIPVNNNRKRKKTVDEKINEAEEQVVSMFDELDMTYLQALRVCRRISKRLKVLKERK